MITSNQLFVDEADDVEIVDRSTAQPWAECPQQEWHIERGCNLVGFEANSGNEVHRLLSQMTAAFVSDGMTASQLRDSLQSWAADSRPDVQPRVVGIIRRCAYGVTQLLCVKSNGQLRSPEDVIAFDGGEGERSGQIAADMLLTIEGEEKTYRLTCELDLLLATASDEELDYVDYKAGWKFYNAEDVKESFQFNFYCYIIFQKFPTIERVRVRVFMCGENLATSSVVFYRNEMFNIGRRIRSALEQRAKYIAAINAADVPGWPELDKCRICPASTKCAVVIQGEDAVTDNPAAYLERYVALDAACDQMKTKLTLYTRQLGHDLIAGASAFGSNKPKSARKPEMAAYDNPDFKPTEIA